MRLARALASLTIPLLLLSACGEDTDGGAADEPKPTASPSESVSESPSPTAEPTPGSPQCVDVWVAGQDLPPRYKGCYEGTEKIKKAAAECSFGRPLIVYADHYYAVSGGLIMQTAKPLGESKEFQDAVKKCRA